MPEADKKSNWFLWLVGLSCLVAISSAFYFFYYKKGYNFVVEVACDTTKEICFQRDCSNPDSCPPNELSNFKRYNLNAGDFSKCENEDCASVCETGIIKCEPIECAEDLVAGESCSMLTVPEGIE